jgi:nucleotide-binding universal stress UspA family protein
MTADARERDGMSSATRRGIIVGVDGSEPARSALRYAAAMAPKLALPLRALVVWDYPALAWGEGYNAEMVEAIEGAARDTARNEADALFPDGRPDWFSIVTRQGGAAGILIEASGESEMLVVGSRGRGGFASLLLGSVSAACAAHARCPVLIVRARAEQPLT